MGRGSFVRELFLGRIDGRWLFPFPTAKSEEIKEGKDFVAQLRALLANQVDPEEIDRTGVIPDRVIQSLKNLGAFGVRIPKEYGGLGLNHTAYVDAFIALGSHCSNLATILSVHQSVGVPQPLLLFGNEEQKKKYLPRLAKGALSAFALTEANVGSDPARMETTAHCQKDGSYRLKGEKLWCSNGPIAELMVVTALSFDLEGKAEGITAFIVDTNTNGFEIKHHCHFMGLRALSNGVVKFNDVIVSKEDILFKPGKGLKVALTTLNTGRLAIASAGLGMAKQCLEMTRFWANERKQWGKAIGLHQAINARVQKMNALVLSMDAMLHYTASVVDTGGADIRMEAAMCKMWCTEKAWEIINHTMQVRGGRGYETVDSLKKRGEVPLPVERFMRDSRITTIFEGSSEIMRLILAREALDFHFNKLEKVIASKQSGGISFVELAKAGMFYLPWYFSKCLPFGDGIAPSAEYDHEWSTLNRFARKLARVSLRLMAKYQEKMEEMQVLVNLLVDIGTNLFAVSVTIAYAEKYKSERPHIADLAKVFCQDSFEEVHVNFEKIRSGHFEVDATLGKSILDGELRWNFEGAVANELWNK